MTALQRIIAGLGNVLLRHLAVLFPSLYRCFMREVICEAGKADEVITEVGLLIAAVPNDTFSDM